MPFDVVGLIIERSDYKEQLLLRKTSKSLRALVDKQKPGCKSIEVFFYKEHLNITYNNQFVEYRSLDYECNNYTVIVVKRDDFKKVALDDLASTLKNPKLQLEEFVVYNGIECSEKNCNEIRNVMKSLSHQVSARKVNSYASSPSCFLSILPCLKPGFLTKIKLHIRGVSWRAYSTGMDQVAVLDQWKQAKELELEDSFNKFPMKYARHFNRLQIYGVWIDNDNLNRIKDFLSETELCTLSWLDFDTNFFALYQLLGEPVSSNATEEVFHHLIPDSDYYFEIKKATKIRRLDIEKKKREIHS
ncbi:unnamed protein product [Caenorhabditis brenneri]